MERKKWLIPEMTDDQVRERIEIEAQTFLTDNSTLTSSSLKRGKRSDLINAVRRYYPGGLEALQDRLGVNVNRKPRGFWQGPRGAERVRIQAQGFYQTEGGLSHTLLNTSGRADLANAIKLYPGGLRGLKRDLEIEPSKKPDGYWSQEKVREEVTSYIESTRPKRFTPNLLSQSSREDLRQAITRSYPGGWTQLRQDLNLSQLRSQNHYWNPETVREEAIRLYNLHNSLDWSVLAENGEADRLNGLIRSYYPGGWAKLRADLGLKSTIRASWTVERIIIEVQAVLQNEGALTQTILEKTYRTGLSRAIKEVYPGGWHQLRADLGLKSPKIKRGYWTDEQIEQEALAFFQQYGTLSLTLMPRVGKGSLRSTITSKYPGGIRALRAKIGINNSSAESITPTQANTDLEKLLEVQT
jgi:hypothetical protein